MLPPDLPDPLRSPAGRASRLLLEQLPGVLWTVDLEGRITTNLGAGLKAFDLPQMAHLGRRMSEFIRPDDPDNATVRMIERALAGESGDYESRYQHTVHRTHVEPLRDENGRIVGVIGVSIDVTASARAQEELERRVRERTRELSEANEALRSEMDRRARAVQRSRRALRELKQAQERLIAAERLASTGMVLAGIAHEINNPLHVIAGNLALLDERLRASGRSAALLEMTGDARAAAERARRVLDEFLQFARRPGRLSRVRLDDVIRESVREVDARTGARPGITVELRELRPVTATAAPLQRCLVNLLLNAAEAAGPRGRVSLTAWQDRSSTLVVVEDDGPGIPRDRLARVFEPFYTSKPNGLGLGLALAQAAVQLHGGRLSIASEPGRGTTVTVDLPRRRRP